MGLKLRSEYSQVVRHPRCSGLLTGLFDIAQRLVATVSNSESHCFACRFNPISTSRPGQNCWSTLSVLFIFPFVTSF